MAMMIALFLLAVATVGMSAASLLVSLAPLTAPCASPASFAGKTVTSGLG